MAPGGWIVRTDQDGKNWELLCAGLRNTYDIAFNTDGELFTFDSDMEWDTGTPWYRPTRVNHLVRGGEYGWRNGTGKWPEYSPDSLGAVVEYRPGLADRRRLRHRREVPREVPAGAVHQRLDLRQDLRRAHDAQRRELQRHVRGVRRRPAAAGDRPRRAYRRRSCTSRSAAGGRSRACIA